MKRSLSIIAFCLAASPTFAQTLPPTPQELQQQHDLAVQNESGNVHSNLSQTQQQIQQQTQQPYLQQPYVTPRGRVVVPPPAYVPTPH